MVRLKRAAWPQYDLGFFIDIWEKEEYRLPVFTLFSFVEKPRFSETRISTHTYCGSERPRSTAT